MEIEKIFKNLIIIDFALLVLIVVSSTYDSNNLNAINQYLEKGLLAKARSKELLEQGVFKLKSFGTGKFGRVLGEIFVSPEFVGDSINNRLTIPIVILICHLMVGLVLMIFL